MRDLENQPIKLICPTVVKIDLTKMNKLDNAKELLLELEKLIVMIDSAKLNGKLTCGIITIS